MSRIYKHKQVREIKNKKVSELHFNYLLNHFVLLQKRNF